MRRRTLLALGLMCAVLGCAGAQRKVEQPVPPKPPEEPWAWLPATATVLGHLDVDVLRESQLWPLWRELKGEQRIASWVEIGKIRHVTFAGFGHSLEDASYVVAIEGRFAADELQTLAVRHQVAPELRGLLTIYRRPEAIWTQITPKLIVVCSPDRLEELVARAGAGPGTPVKDAPLYRSLAPHVGIERAHIGLLADDPEGKRRALVDRQASRLGLGSIVREAERVGASLDVGATYHLTALAEAADGTRAGLLEADVRDRLDALSSNFMVRILGVARLLETLRVASDGSHVFVRAAIPEQELNPLLHRLQSVLDIAGGAAAAGL